MTSDSRRSFDSGAAKAAFSRDGFCVGPAVLDGHRLTSVRQAVDRIVGGGADGGRVRTDRDARPQVHAVGIWRTEPAVRDLAFDDAVVGVACRLMGTASVRLFRDQIFVKSPQSPRTVPWHQDYSDWTYYEPAEHLTCWVALDDSDESNGCMRYLPGSHATTPVLPKISRSDDLDSAFGRLPAPLREHFAPDAVRVPAGSCSFHHCLTVHATHGNDTDAPRRAVAITYAHPDLRLSVLGAADGATVPDCPEIPAPA